MAAMRTAPRLPARPRQAGFSLIELMVSIAVMVIVIIGILMLFDLNTKLARAQTNLAEMQQSVRVAQYTMLRNTRMAGRGNLPVGTLPAGFSLAVRDDVASGGGSTDLAIGYPGSPQVVAGSDVLTVRGVFSNPIWQLNHLEAGTFSVGSAGGEVVGTLRILDRSHTFVDQPTESLVQSIEAGIPEALVLTSPLDDDIFAVVEVDPDASNVTNPADLAIAFRYTGGTHTDRYEALTASPGGMGVFPPALNSVAFVGILEEYRYYVRAERAVPGDDSSELRPRLAEARMFPGTEVPYQVPPFDAADPPSARTDVADNILDLQIALGIDLDDDGIVVDQGDDADEWLYNHPDDDDSNPAVDWNPPGQPGRRLAYVRLSTLARTERRDWQYVAPPIQAIENRDYGEAAVPASEPNRQDRMFRRRLLETVIDMRNL